MYMHEASDVSYRITENEYFSVMFTLAQIYYRRKIEDDSYQLGYFQQKQLAN